MAASNKEAEMAAEIERLKQDIKKLNRDLEWSKKDNNKLQEEMFRMREEMSQLERCKPEIVRASGTYKELLGKFENYKKETGGYRKAYAILFDESAEMKRTIEELRMENDQLKRSSSSGGRKPTVPKELRELIVRAHETRVAIIKDLVDIINSAEVRSKLRDQDDLPKEILALIETIDKENIRIHVSKSTIHRELSRARKKTGE